MATEGDIPCLEDFLDSLKLKQLFDLFLSSDTTSVEELLDFDDAALQGIGVEKPGHRKRMINELKSLRLRFSLHKEAETESPENSNTKSLSEKHEVQTDPTNTQVETSKEVNGSPDTEADLPPLPPKLKPKAKPPTPLPREVPPPALQKVVPEIPPRTDLDEATNCPGTGDHKPIVGIGGRAGGSMKTKSSETKLFVEKGPVNRALSMPMVKRKAPDPPQRTFDAKMQEESSELANDSLEEKTSSKKQNVLLPSISLNEDSQIEKQANDHPIAKRPDALSIVKNEELRGRLSSLISPKRSAPLPPKNDRTETKEEADSKDEDGSSDSDDAMITGPECEIPRSDTNRRLEEDLVVKRASVAPGKVSKCGFLEKRGGQNNKKGFQNRWVVFDGNDLRYYKPNDKDSRNDCLQIVPLSRMKDVRIDTPVGKDKRLQLFLQTPNRTFIFASDDRNEIGLWANVLMQAIMCLRQEMPGTTTEESIGGEMSDPDKEGWLKKQGHNVARDWKDRYVVFKDGKVAYYRNYEDYKQGLPINCLNMALSTIRQDPSRCRITMITAQQRDFLFEASDEASFQEWVTAFETSIQIALGDTTVLKAIQENPSNRWCGDCGKRNPVWASVNLLVIVCDQCIGIHRKLGAQISKARSILMDVKVWNEPLKQLMQKVGNENSNRFWEHMLPEDDKINTDCTSEQRYDFIVSKYKDKKYIKYSEFYGQEDNLGEALRNTVVTDDVLTTLQLIICGASVYYTMPGCEGESTPYELATAANQELQMELLRQFNGHYTAEEREKVEREEAERIRKANEEAVLNNTPQPPTWEKQGTILKRGPKNNEPWKPRTFYLQRRSLYYQKDREKELIDLREVTDIQMGVNGDDPKTINIVLPNRTYYLKGENLPDARSWYWALKNKQVFGVAIENQELNGKKIPLLVAKCIDYVKFNALHEEGIYRKSGSATTVRALKLTFNQDAAAVRLTLDEYPFVHDICSLLKLYFREGLPEPLMTNHLYESYIENSVNADHDTRLSNLYELIHKLPEVNAATLKYLVIHLDEIIRHSDENLMTKENVNRLFAPIILNQGRSTHEQILCREYAVFNDVLTYYTYFFDVDPSEQAKKLEEFENAKRVMNDAMKQKEKISAGFKIDEMQISVSIQDGQDSCMVKVNKKMTASEICLYIIKLKSLSLDGNWALFQKIGGAGLERPLHTKELVFPLLMESIKQEDERIYSLKNNYVFEMTAPYQDARLSIRGKLHWKKNDGSWKDHFLMIRTGDLIISLKERGSEVEKLPIHQWLLFMGNERAKRKSPKKYGFTLINGNEKRHICTDDDKYMNRWICAILQIKYPNGIWTNLQEAERTMTSITEDIVPLNQRRSVFLGRQSTVLREQGSSRQVQKELQVKRQSLKRVR